MSFGFSVGDFLAVGQLTVNIVASLRESGGAKTEYQDLIRELESLHYALQHLDKLQSKTGSSSSLDSIKYAALSCRRPLEEFLGKIQRYNRSLDVWAKNETNAIKGTLDKVRWAFGQKDEIQKLQSYMNVHVATINMLLAEYGLEKINLVSDKAEAAHQDIERRLEDTRGLLEQISESGSAQLLVVQKVNSMTRKLFQMVNGELRASWRSLGEMVAKQQQLIEGVVDSVTTQQTYSIVLEIKSSLAPIDPRWTFFQAPFVVEDALGLKFPVPSEYDFELLTAIIKHRFQEGPGSGEVQAGDYEIFKTKNRKTALSSGDRLLPGTAITMAVIVKQRNPTGEACPMPQCGSDEVIPMPGGGTRCSLCNVWFDRSQRKRKIVEVDDDDEQPNGSNRTASLSEERKYSTHKKRQKRSQPSLRFDCFHNVLVADWTPLHWAAANGHETVVKLLLEKSADEDRTDRDMRTPLYLAALKGHDTVVKLLDKGAKPAHFQQRELAQKKSMEIYARNLTLHQARSALNLINRGLPNGDMLNPGVMPTQRDINLGD
ncbi:hypothetical protein N7540_002969 [Penicillium herquei]|nr:hypothetical protein N7540_002969 [Penicillium herquei]